MYAQCSLFGSIISWVEELARVWVLFCEVVQLISGREVSRPNGSCSVWADSMWTVTRHLYFVMLSNAI